MQNKPNGESSSVELAACLHAKRGEIVKAWRERVLNDPFIPRANQLDEPILIDHLPDFIDAVTLSLEEQKGGDGEEKGRQAGKGRAAKKHAHLRILVGYSLPETLRELSHLRNAILDSCHSDMPEPEAASLLHTAIDLAMSQVAEEIARERSAEKMAHVHTREFLQQMIDGVRDRAIFMVGIQDKLLRAIQSKEITPVGGTRSQRVDVRIIAATSENLDAMVADGRFRQDLLERLKGIWIEIPPLRERPEDIQAIAEAIVAKSNKPHLTFALTFLSLLRS